MKIIYTKQALKMLKVCDNFTRSLIRENYEYSKEDNVKILVINKIDTRGGVYK